MVDKDKDDWEFVCRVRDCGRKFVRRGLLSRHEERHRKKERKDKKKYRNVACPPVPIAPSTSPISSPPSSEGAPIIPMSGSHSECGEDQASGPLPFKEEDYPYLWSTSNTTFATNDPDMGHPKAQSSNYDNSPSGDHQVFLQNLGPQLDPFEFQSKSSKAIAGEQTTYHHHSQVSSNAFAHLRPADEHARGCKNETVYAVDSRLQLKTGLWNGTPSAFDVSVPSQSLQLANGQHEPVHGLLGGGHNYPSFSIVTPGIHDSILKYLKVGINFDLLMVVATGFSHCFLI